MKTRTRNNRKSQIEKVNRIARNVYPQTASSQSQFIRAFNSWSQQLRQLGDAMIDPTYYSDDESFDGFRYC